MGIVSKTFFRKIPINIILSLKKNKQLNASILSKDINSTYAYIVQNLGEFKEMGLVSSKKKGRQNIVTLTEKGNKVADLLHEIKEIL